MPDKHNITFGDLLQKIEQSGKQYDVATITKAYEVAAKAHGEQ